MMERQENKEKGDGGGENMDSFDPISDQNGLYGCRAVGKENGKKTVQDIKRQHNQEPVLNHEAVLLEVDK